MFFLFALVQLISGRWEVRTCSGCKLNRLPDVRKFIKEETGGYEDLTVKYIHGRNPDLVRLGENGEETEIYDLSKLDTSGLRSLLISKGIKPKTNSIPDL